MSVLKKQNNIIAYGRKKLKMTVVPNNQQRQNGHQNTQETEIRRSENGNAKRILDWLGIAGGITTLIGFIIAAVLAVMIPIIRHTSEIEGIQKSVDSLNDYVKNDIKGDMGEDINDISLDIKNLSEYVYSNSGKGEESYGNNKEGTKRVDFYEEYIPKIDLNENEPNLKETEWKKYVFVAEDEDGIRYTSEDLYNKTFVTSYIEDGKEIYFLGQINKNNAWYGKCVLNVYNGKQLESVLEAIYNDGVLYSYKRVSKEKDGTWKVVDKVDKGEYKTGETWYYKSTHEIDKKVFSDDYDENRILKYEDFGYLREEELILYYNGKTSGGKYNDDTGNAYLVNYKDDGNVDILYKGKFFEGRFHDQDKNAKSWFIGWGKDNKGYYFYKGNFNKGNHGNPPNPWEPLKQEEIDEIVNPKEYKCKLTGLIK